MKINPTTSALAIFALAAVTSAAIGWAVSGRVEGEVQQRAQQAVHTTGLQWASVQTDGLMVSLSGEAPAASQKDVVVRAVSGALTWLTVRDEITIADRPEVFQPDATLRIMRGIGYLTVTGAVPGADTRDAVAAALNAALPDLSLTDLVRTDARGEDAFASIARDLAAITAELLHGTIIVEGNDVTVSGIASGTEEQQAIAKRVAALVNAQWAVKTTLATPPPRVSELVFHAETGEGARGLISCTATDADEAERIRARAEALFGANSACNAAPADETPGWGDAVIAALDALAEMPSGEVRLTGHRVRMSSAPPTRKRELDDATAKLRAELPEGFKLMLLTPPPVAVDSTAAPASTAFRIEYDGVQMRLSGDAPSPILAETLGSFARATLSGVVIDASEITLRPEVPADSWRKATMGLVLAIAELETGSGEITGDHAVIEGTIEQPSRIAGVQRIATQTIGAERQVQTRLRVAMNDLAAAQPLPPSRCAEEMSKVTAATPILFAPGSTKVGEANAPIISRLVTILSSCTGGRIEIGGHTDNDGPEALNERLSRQRAEAVLGALQRAGARTSLLSAKGYGESQPVADNNTEAGRRANRRIAFQAVTTDEAEAAAPLDADSSGDE